MSAGGNGEVRTPELRVLGPLDAYVTAPGPRRLLALLALHAGDVVRRDAAMEVLWPRERPATAPKALQNHVVVLRKALGAQAIETTPDGYRLTLTTDAGRFIRLIKVAPADALACWRGMPWQDLEDHPPAVADAARLTELRHQAEEALVASTLDPVDARRLVDEQPYRETRWCLLVHALYRSGRQMEALRAAQEARGRLADEVGCEPGPELRAMETAVARHDPSLGPVEARLDGNVCAVAIARGLEALRGEMPADAARWLRVAGDSTEALTALGRAQLALGEVAAGRATLVRAFAVAAGHGDIKAQADVLAAFMFNSGQVAPSDPVTHAFEKTLARRGDLDDGRRAELCAAWIAYASAFRPVADLRALSEEAVVFGRRCGGDVAVLTVAADALLLCRPHDADQRLGRARQLAAMRRDLDHDLPFVRWMQLWAERSALLELGDRAERDVREAMIDVAARNRHAGDAWLAAAWGQGVEHQAGDFDGAEGKLADWAAGMAGHDDPVAVARIAPVYLMTIRWMQGRLGELRPALEELSVAFDFLVPLRTALALAYAHEGDIATAITLAEPLLVGGGVAPTAPTPQWPVLAVHLAELAVLARRRDWATILADEIEPVADRHAVFAGKHLGAYAHHLGRLQRLLGDRAAATASFRAAAEANERLGSTWWASRSRHEASAVAS